MILYDGSGAGVLFLSSSLVLPDLTNLLGADGFASLGFSLQPVSPDLIFMLSIAGFRNGLHVKQEDSLAGRRFL